MKKLSKEQKTYWLCRLKKNEAKKHKGSRRKKSYKMTRVYTPKSSATLIQAPENFQLNPKKNRTKTLAFFESLRAAAKSKKDITIDFRETSMMFADASILLKAEIERLMQYFPSMKWKCVLPKSNRTKQVLYQIDLLNILKCNHHITVVLPLRGRKTAFNETFHSLVPRLRGEQGVQVGILTGLRPLRPPRKK